MTAVPSDEPVNARINWHSFSAAPHRMFFWSGTLFGLVAVASWTLQQASLYTGLLAPFTWSVPYPAAHGFMMTYGWLGFFIFGFLLTTFPRWLDTEPVPRPAYLAAWTAMSAGAALFWAGLFLEARVVAAGTALIAAGYAVAIAFCARVWLTTGNPERGQQAWLLLALTTGVAGILLAAYGFGWGHYGALDLSRRLSLHPFLLGTILTVLYRMIPFFTTMVSPGMELRRTRRGVEGFQAVLWGRFAVETMFGPAWTWPADLLLLGLLAREMFVWRFWRANFPPLLLILYLALGWMAASFALSGIGGAVGLVLGRAPGPLGYAALHALTLGGFGGLVLGIGTRVSLGHSGRGLATDRLLAVLFFGFQLAPLLRIAPELLAPWWPALRIHSFWAGLVWLVVFIPWFARIGPVLMRPRSDGRPG